MGIIRSNAAFYLEARARGVTFGRTLTLGRQRLYLRPRDLADVAARFRPELSTRIEDLHFGDPADTFLERFLDVRELQTLDHSSYEGASLFHDLNQPLPDAMDEQFDAVIDSGTLEHVFNVPAALTTCMRLVKRGGSLFLSSPANNLCGHGFYQFSPELFFRVFKNANGFTLTRLILVTHPFPGAELGHRQTWYDVTDPADIGARAPLMTSSPAFLMLEARRVDIVPVLLTAPQQSDYVARWSADAEGPRRDAASTLRAAARLVFDRLPDRAQALAIGWYQRALQCTLRNRRAFRRIIETDPPSSSSRP